MGLLMSGFAGRWYAPQGLDPEVEAQIMSGLMQLDANLETQQAKFQIESLSSLTQQQVAAWNALVNLHGTMAQLMQVDVNARQAYAAELDALSAVLQQELINANQLVPEGVANATASAASGLGVTVKNAARDGAPSLADQIKKNTVLDAPFHFGIYVAEKTNGTTRQTINQIVADQRVQGRKTIDIAVNAEAQLRREMRSAALAVEDSMSLPPGTLSNPEAINTAMYSAGFALPSGSAVMIGGTPYTQEQIVENPTLMAGLDPLTQQRLLDPLVPRLIQEAAKEGESIETRQQQWLESNMRMEKLKQRLTTGPATSEKQAVLSAINGVESSLSEMQGDPTYMARRLSEMPSLGGIQDAQARIDSQLEYLRMSKDPVEQKINQLYVEFGEDFMKSYAMVAFDGLLRQPNTEDVMLSLHTEEGSQNLIMAHQLYSNAPNLYANDPQHFWKRLQQNGIPVNALQRKTGRVPGTLSPEENEDRLIQDALLGSDQAVVRNGNLMPSAYRAVLSALQPSQLAGDVPAAPAAAAVSGAPPAVPEAPVGDIDLLEDEVADADIVIPPSTREPDDEWGTRTITHSDEEHTYQYELRLDGSIFTTVTKNAEMGDVTSGLEVVSSTELDPDNPAYDKVLEDFDRIHPVFTSRAAGVEAAGVEAAKELPESLDDLDARVRAGEVFSNEEIAAVRRAASSEELLEEVPVDTPRPTLRDRVAKRKKDDEDVEKEPFKARAEAALKRFQAKRLERDKDFERATKMRYQPDEAVIPKPPTPKRRDTSGVAPPPRRKTAEPTPISGKKPSKPTQKAAETHEKEVSGIVEEYGSGQQPTGGAWGEMQDEVDKSIRQGKLPGSISNPGPDDTPAGKPVSTDEAAERTLPSPTPRNLGL